MLPLRRARAMAMGKKKLKALGAMLGSCGALGFVGDNCRIGSQLAWFKHQGSCMDIYTR
jgi:hypothetical protein